MRRASVLLAVALVVAVPSAAGVTASDGEAAETDCSPPCGEINPRIVFEFSDLSDDPIELSAGETKTFEGTVTYWTDTDDEGHSPRDPSQDIVIRFSFPQLPSWAEMSVEPQEITVPVNSCAQCFEADTDDSRPTAHYEYSEPIKVTVTAKEAPQATTGYDYGKLQLFAKSTESAIYNPGYGIREIRVDPGASGDDLASQSTDEANGVPGAGAIAAIAVLAAAAVAARRRA